MCTLIVPQYDWIGRFRCCTSIPGSVTGGLASTGVQNLVPWLGGAGALILAGVAAMLIRLRLRRRSA